MTFLCQTWTEEIDRTFLADSGKMGTLDRWVRAKLIAHRIEDLVDAQSVAPWSVEVLVREVVVFGEQQKWLWAITAIALLQELVFCCEGGGLTPSTDLKHRDLCRDAKALQELRNVVMHPAFQLSGGGNTAPMVRLIALLRIDDDPDIRQQLTKLERNWAAVADRPVAVYALRKLNSAIILFAHKKKIFSS